MSTFPVSPMLEEFTAIIEGKQEFRSFYPRRVITPTGYLNIKYVAARFFEAFLATGEIPTLSPSLDRDTIRPSTATLVTIGHFLLQTDVQYFWLGKDIGHDFINTRLPDDYSLDNLPWPFDAFTLMLPYGLIQSSHGNVSHISIAHVDPLIHIVATHNTGDVDEARLSATFCVDSKEDSFTLKSLGETTDYYTSTQASQTDQQLMVTCMQLMANVMFYMVSEGASIEESQQVGKPKKKFNDSGLWTPKWVGQYHKRDRNISEGGGGTKRMHWRRGHWRNHAIGEGHSNHKRIWMKPMLIKGNAAV